MPILGWSDGAEQHQRDVARLLRRRRRARGLVTLTWQWSATSGYGRATRWSRTMEPHDGAARWSRTMEPAHLKARVNNDVGGSMTASFAAPGNNSPKRCLRHWRVRVHPDNDQRRRAMRSPPRVATRREAFWIGADLRLDFSHEPVAARASSRDQDGLMRGFRQGDSSQACRKRIVRRRLRLHCSNRNCAQ